MAATTHPRPVRVAVANDYELVVAGVASMLSRFPDQVEVTELAVGSVPEERVDVVLFDTYGARHGRLAALAAEPTIDKLAVYTLRWDAVLVREALADGADAVLSKSLGPAELVSDLSRVAMGQSIVDPGPPLPEAAADAQGEQVGRSWPGAELDLSERESEVLALVAGGLSNQEVGRVLHLGVNTVKTHLRNAYRKAGVRNRAQAAGFVLRQRPAPRSEG